MFDDGPSRPDSVETEAPARPVAAPVPRAEADATTLALVGLCVNCDLRGACVHGRQTGGVWHCENYQ